MFIFGVLVTLCVARSAAKSEITKSSFTSQHRLTMVGQFSLFGSGFLLIVLFIVAPHGASDLSCGGAEPCPAGTKCVEHAGCVAVAEEGLCRCKKSACPWPQKCDCKGGCAPRSCSTTENCGRHLTNPANACQQMKCSPNNLCVVAHTNCSKSQRCDRTKGCVDAPVPKSQNTEQKKVVQGQDWDGDDGWVGDDDIGPGGRDNWIYFLIAWQSLLGLLFLIAFVALIVLAFYQRRTGA